MEDWPDKNIQDLAIKTLGLSADFKMFSMATIIQVVVDEEEMVLSLDDGETFEDMLPRTCPEIRLPVGVAFVSLTDGNVEKHGFINRLKKD